MFNFRVSPFNKTANGHKAVLMSLSEELAVAFLAFQRGHLKHVCRVALVACVRRG